MNAIRRTGACVLPFLLVTLPAAQAGGGAPDVRAEALAFPPSIRVAGLCAGTVRDAADPGACLEASSLPELGKLFPINRRLYVDTLGRVGFGTTTPLSKMHVVTTAPSHCIVYLQSSGPTYGESGIRFRTGQSTLSGWDLYMDDSTLDELGDPDRLGFYHASAGVVMALDVVGGAGRVGINKRDPSVALDVDGDVCASGMYLTCSDARLKTDVTDLEGALEAILALRGVRFRWAAEPPDDGAEIGFLAQEVAEVVPEVVSRAADGRWSVDYARLTPVLVEAIQAQESRLDELAAENAELRRTNEALIDRLERLESLVALGR